MTRRIACGGPEATGVGCEHLVDERKTTVDEAKLELGVGDDDAATRCVCGGGGIDPKGGIADLLGHIHTHDVAAALKRDVLVVLS